MSPAARRGPYARTKERRETIADAALDLVVEQGHRSLTTLAVANRAGISEPGLLYHYPSKEAVLVAALARFDVQQIAPLAPGEALGTAPARAASRMTGANVARLYAALLGEASNPDHPAAEYFRDRWRAARQIYAQDIRLLQERGEVDDAVDPQRAAGWIVAALDGLQLHWLVDPTFDIESELRDVIELVLPRTQPPRGAGRGARAPGR